VLAAGGVVDPAVHDPFRFHDLAGGEEQLELAGRRLGTGPVVSLGPGSGHRLLLSTGSRWQHQRGTRAGAARSRFELGRG
jgi:hypothetical protein